MLRNGSTRSLGPFQSTILRSRDLTGSVSGMREETGELASYRSTSIRRGIDNHWDCTPKFKAFT